MYNTYMKEDEQKIVAYATNDKGQGRVMKIGEFDSIEDIEIIVGMFDKDVVINFEYEKTD